jgi:N6-adenosine-specific RNA methylase IME4
VKFEIILVDCPWTYDDKANAGKRGAVHKYPLMSQADLCALPVQDLAADNCVLFSWSTWPKIDDGRDVIDAWGFKYKTCAFNWVKTTKDGTRYRQGMGRWTRSNSEFVLLATKGKPPRESANVNQIIAAPPGRHSAKPPITRDRIVELCGDVPRVELFARERCDGWMSLGYDVDGLDLRESIPDLSTF